MTTQTQTTQTLLELLADERKQLENERKQFAIERRAFDNEMAIFLEEKEQIQINGIKETEFISLVEKINFVLKNIDPEFINKLKNYIDSFKKPYESDSYKKGLNKLITTFCDNASIIDNYIKQDITLLGQEIDIIDEQL